MSGIGVKRNMPIVARYSYRYYICDFIAEEIALKSKVKRNYW